MEPGALGGALEPLLASMEPRVRVWTLEALAAAGGEAVGGGTPADDEAAAAAAARVERLAELLEDDDAEVRMHMPMHMPMHMLEDEDA